MATKNRSVKQENKMLCVPPMGQQVNVTQDELLGIATTPELPDELKARMHDLAQWLISLSIPHKKYDITLSRNAKNEIVLIIDLFTATTHYSIIANINRDYLGGCAKSRKLRAGEDWQRGFDLVDGRISEGLWHEIIKQIFRSELVDVQHRRAACAENTDIDSA